MRLFFLILLIPSLANAATYSYYFATAGDDSTGAGTEASPWATVSKAQSAMSALLTSDIVYLYFNKGDTWTYNSAVVSTNQTYGIYNSDASNDPVTHVDAYGTGDKPIFDGLVTDFSSVPDHDSTLTTGPYRWNRFFHFEIDGCSVSNVEIKQVYGHAVYLNGANDFILENCLIWGVGSAALAYQGTVALDGVEVAYNTIHTAQELFRYDKLGTAGWAGAIILGSTGSGVTGNHYVHHNTIYDVMGEGMNIHNSIIEYNIIGDTCSVGLMAESHFNDAEVSRIRYNIVMFSDATSDYDVCVWPTGGNGKPDGIRIYDDSVGGDNSAADYEVHDNIIINRDVGFWFFTEDYSNHWGSIKIYNNLVIDSVVVNYRMRNAYTATIGQFTNNSSVFYDSTALDHMDDDSSWPDSGWTISGNHFWHSGIVTGDIDSDWTGTMDITDPELLGATTTDWISRASNVDWIDPKTEIAPPGTSYLTGWTTLYMDILDLGNEGGSGTCTTPPSWNSTTGITNAVDEATGGAVFTYANQATAICGTSTVTYTRYYAPTSSWNSDCGSNTEWLPGASPTPWIVTGLTNGTNYTFCIRASDSLGNEETNNVTATATPTDGTVIYYNVGAVPHMTD